MRNPILEEASVEVVPPEHVVSNSVQGLDLNINTCTVADTEFASDFVLEIIRDCELTAIVGYFNSFFELLHPAVFSTGPSSTPTHWKQTVFYLPEKVPLVEGQKVEGRMVCKWMMTDARGIKVSLTLDGKNYLLLTPTNSAANFRSLP
jgi:protein arginine N-methyltransferase 3